MLSQTIVNGLLLGGLYGAASIGFSLTWGVMGVINVAHGAFVMVGAYVAYAAFAYWGWDPLLALPFAMAILFVLGWLMQATLINRLLDGSLLLSLAVTFGIDLVLTSVVKLVFSSDVKAVNVSWAADSVQIGDAIVPLARGVVFLLALAMAVFFYVGVNRTSLGQSILATALDKQTARLMGIYPKRVFALTSGIGAALAGGAGALASMLFPISPHMGFPFMGAAFVIAVLGGIGSIEGAILGGMIYGLIQSLAAEFLGLNYQEIVGFTLFLVIILVRPQGLLGRRFYGEIS